MHSSIRRKDRKEATTIFSVNPIRSQVIYLAAQPSSIHQYQANNVEKKQACTAQGSTLYEPAGRFKAQQDTQSAEKATSEIDWYELCRVLRYRSLHEELTGSSCRSDALRQALTAEDSMTNASLYVLLRAADRFSSKHHRFPGSFDE